MRLLWYSINVPLDGCCDHRAIPAGEELHRHAVENLNRADALLFGRVAYEMIESAFRSPAWEALPDWMHSFGRTIDAARKYVVSSTLNQVDWNAELDRGALEVRRLEARGTVGVQARSRCLAVRAETVGSRFSDSLKERGARFHRAGSL